MICNHTVKNSLRNLSAFLVNFVQSLTAILTDDSIDFPNKLVGHQRWPSTPFSSCPLVLSSRNSPTHSATLWWFITSGPYADTSLQRMSRVEIPSWTREMSYFEKFSIEGRKSTMIHPSYNTRPRPLLLSYWFHKTSHSVRKITL